MNTCQRITGKAFEPHYWQDVAPERRGPRRPVDEVNPNRGRRGRYSLHSGRPEPVYDVLCGAPVQWEVRPQFESANAGSRCCTQCLSSVIADMESRTGKQVVVSRMLRLIPQEATLASEQATNFGNGA